MCEMRVYNFLYLRNIKLYKHQNYEGDLSAYIDDGRFYSKKKQKWIIIEIFGDKRGNYEERKRKKLKYWKENEYENKELLALTYDDTTKKSKLIEIFEPYLGILDEKELTDDFLEEMKKYNYNNINLQKRYEIINEAKEIKRKAPDGFLPPISELPAHISNFIHSKRFDGGVDDFRKLLGENIKEAKKVAKKTDNKNEKN